MRPLLFPLAAIAAVALPWLAACQQVPVADQLPKVVGAPAQRAEWERLVNEARGAFLKETRDVRSCLISAERFAQAAALRTDDYETMWESARTCAWLSQFGPEHSRIEYARRGLQYANTALTLKPDGEEARFFRGLLAGKLGELDITYLPTGLETIVSDMRALVLQGSTYGYGGPDRVLGMIYLKSPGDPIGPGSFFKARQHLARAYEIEPHWHENQLAMAEFEFRYGKHTGDAALIKSAKKRLEEHFLGDDAKAPMGSGFEFRIWQQDAHKLMAEIAES